MWLFGCRTMLEILATSAGALTSAADVVAGVPVAPSACVG
jgi:hypothetical protein